MCLLKQINKKFKNHCSKVISKLKYKLYYFPSFRKLSRTATSIESLLGF